MNFMQKLLLNIFFVFALAMPAAAQSPDIIKDKVWNRWTSQSFTIHTIANEQGEYLEGNLEGVKKWVLTRWGLTNIGFDVDVKLWCVKDRELFKALYPSLKGSSKVEVRKKDGKVEVIEAFLLLDDVPSRVLPKPMTEICMALFEEKNNVKFGWWAYRGMILLNGSEVQIRTRLKELSKIEEESILSSKQMLTVTKEDYAKLTSQDKMLFDSEAMVACLLLRKEFGQNRMLHFLKEADPEKGLQTIYGFKNYDHFDSSLHPYLRDLVRDVSEGKTPSHYLLIQKAGG